MTRSLYRGLELRDPTKDEAVWTVLSDMPIDGRIKVFDHAVKDEKYKEIEELKAQIIGRV